MTKENIPPVAWMSVGIPGSGKTTALKQFAQESGTLYLSSDEFREKISGDAADQSVSGQAWSMVYEQAEAALQNGQSVIIDGTHARFADRVKATERYRKSGATIVALCFDVDVDTAERRIAGRDRKVPRFVLERMSRELAKNPVSYSDGFDVIINANDVDTQRN